MTIRQRACRQCSVRYSSPLRYPGGKAKFAEFVKAVFRANGLLDGEYAEPYAGGASVALTLLFEEYASRIHINDLDPGVFAFWYSVLHETEALCRLVRDTSASVVEWERQRRIYFNAAKESRLAHGFATFFLNRTNRSGIISSASMIGGRRQCGRWKLDARYNQEELTGRIARIARYSDRITLSNLDALKFLARFTKNFPQRALVYLDPPYYVKGRRRLYANYYSDEDHEKISSALSSLRVRWLVSYDDTPEIRHLYEHYRSIKCKVRYTAGNRYDGSELLVFCDRLVIPRREEVGGMIRTGHESGMLSGALT